MSDIIFFDKSKKPADKDLENVIGKNFMYWKKTDERVKAEVGDTAPDWKICGKNYGSHLNTLFKKRNFFPNII